MSCSAYWTAPRNSDSPSHHVAAAVVVVAFVVGYRGSISTGPLAMSLRRGKVVAECEVKYQQLHSSSPFLRSTPLSDRGEVYIQRHSIPDLKTPWQTG